jgi:hypothetical protein
VDYQYQAPQICHVGISGRKRLVIGIFWSDETNPISLAIYCISRNRRGDIVEYLQEAKMNYTRNRRDGNELGLVQYWRERGWRWLPQSAGAGHDGFLRNPQTGETFVVEIKMPGHTDRHWFTERELRLMDFLGDKYHVVATRQDAARLIGQAAWPPDTEGE